MRQKHWLADEAGTKVAVDDKAQRDYLVGGCWSETTEAVGDEFVWVRHPEAASARVPAASLDTWIARGWEIGLYPSPVLEEPVTAPAAPKPKLAAAGGGDTKEN